MKREKEKERRVESKGAQGYLRWFVTCILRFSFLFNFDLYLGVCVVSVFFYFILQVTLDCCSCYYCCCCCCCCYKANFQVSLSLFQNFSLWTQVDTLTHSLTLKYADVKIHTNTQVKRRTSSSSSSCCCRRRKVTLSVLILLLVCVSNN